MHNPPAPFQSLPGTEQPARALFIDRWGTLLETPSKGVARHPDDVRFFPGAIDALFRATRAGWKVYLIGNEDAVARGRLSDANWEAVRATIEQQLANAGVCIARFYACLDHPKGKGKHQLDSVYLMPNTGVMYHAAHRDGVVLPKSWVIGDSSLELVAGWRAGCRLAAVRTGQALEDGVFEVHPEFVGDDLAQAVLALLGVQAVYRT